MYTLGENYRKLEHTENKVMNAFVKKTVIVSEEKHNEIYKKREKKEPTLKRVVKPLHTVTYEKTQGAYWRHGSGIWLQFRKRRLQRSSFWGTHVIYTIKDRFLACLLVARIIGPLCQRKQKIE